MMGREFTVMSMRDVVRSSPTHRGHRAFIVQANAIYGHSARAAHRYRSA